MTEMVKVESGESHNSMMEAIETERLSLFRKVSMQSGDIHSKKLQNNVSRQQSIKKVDAFEKIMVENRDRYEPLI
jgi:hypothetical protein